MSVGVCICLNVITAHVKHTERCERSSRDRSDLQFIFSAFWHFLASIGDIRGHVVYCESIAILLCEEDDDDVVAKPTHFLFIYVSRFSSLFTCFILHSCLAAMPWAFVWIVTLINVLICCKLYCRNSHLFCVFDTVILFEISFGDHSECLVPLHFSTSWDELTLLCPVKKKRHQSNRGVIWVWQGLGCLVRSIQSHIWLQEHGHRKHEKCRWFLPQKRV